jgi:hypothetical protein
MSEMKTMGLQLPVQAVVDRTATGGTLNAGCRRGCLAELRRSTYAGPGPSERCRRRCCMLHKGLASGRLVDGCANSVRFTARTGIPEAWPDLVVLASERGGYRDGRR